MIRSTLIAFTLIVAASVPGVASAQALPFRAGQWGAEFSSGDLNTVGMMRFVSPRSAFVFDVGMLDFVIDEEAGLKQSQRRLELRLGLRNYRPVATRVSGFWSVGATAAYWSQKQESSSLPASRYERNETTIGAFAQLGADFHITSNIAAGVAYGLSLTRMTGDAISEPGEGQTDVSGHQFGGRVTPIRVSLFF